MSAPKTEAPGWQARGFGEQATTDNRDSTSASPDSKAFANVRAALALKGYGLLRLHDGSLMIERWGYSRACDGITQAAQFLAQIGAR